jgi:hypothetical protein
MISVVGDSNDYNANMILENILFSSFRPPDFSKGAGVVNGGAIYGAFLHSVSISEGVFELSSTYLGSGGALYIEDVKTTLKMNGGMNIWIVVKEN